VLVTYLPQDNVLMELDYWIVKDDGLKSQDQKKAMVVKGVLLYTTAPQLESAIHTGSETHLVTTNKLQITSR
jgi:hypothetical protein